MVHYHLRRGGVTRVVETASACLSEAGVEHVVLTGEPYRGGHPLPWRRVDGLGYLDHPGHRRPEGLVEAMRRAARDALGTATPLWHVHNHSLGKNPLVAPAVAILADDGDRLLLQVHDFAEDGRPGNYRLVRSCERLYPHAPRVRYALLNSRDRALMVDAGLPADRACLLPNAVAAPPAAPRPSLDGPPLVLYPVRGIRRKNLGELFLLAALAPASTRFAVTLGAENPAWRPVHDGWREFAASSGLPVDLEVVGRIPPRPDIEPGFPQWLAHASHLVTTSVAEGFGLAFLEPVALGKPLLGRDLPEITRDFTAAGIAPGRLYHRMLVPWPWVDAAALRRRLGETLGLVFEAFGRTLDAATVDATWRSLDHGGALDFANLPEDFQRPIIERTRGGDRGAVLVGSPAGCRPAADWLADALLDRRPADTPAALAPFSPAAYGPRLLGLYRDLWAAGAAEPDHLPAGRVLDRFLSPERFHFLRT